MIKKKRDRNDQKNVLFFFLGGWGKGEGVSRVFFPLREAAKRREKRQKKTGEKKPRKGKKKKKRI